MWDYVFIKVVSAVLLMVAHLWLMKRATKRATEKAQIESAALIDSLTGSVNALMPRVTDAERKALEYFAAIESACRERDEWRSMYQRSSLSHGAAQELMLREIEKLARTVRACGKEPKLNPVLRVMKDEFFEGHVEPIKKSLEEKALEKGQA